MAGSAGTNGFYDTLSRVSDFSDLLNAEVFNPLPEDWWVGVADVVNSTDEIAAGRYKVVNMVAAAVISAVMNGLEGRAFPFVFGGDGAGFAVWPQAASASESALAAVQRWAQDLFGIKIRVAMVRVSQIVAAGHHVNIARYQVSPGADYAMFTGGGLSWAEDRMKAGDFTLAPAPEGTLPDLTGLSCRWSHMPARNGEILSLLVLPDPAADPSQTRSVMGQALAMAQELDRGGHPVPAAGPGSDWPTPGTTLEAWARRGTGSLYLSRLKVLFETFVAWVLLRTGWSLAGFDARRYARIVGENADFRKLDDGLKMTLDIDPVVRQRLESLLERAKADGLLRYGMALQDAAMMTCIVPSVLSDDHVHFVDGAAGGYTSAAAQMRDR